MSYESQYGTNIVVPTQFINLPRESRNRRIAINQAPPSGTTVLTQTSGNTTPQGTVTNVGDVYGRWLNHATAASSGALGGRNVVANFLVREKPIVCITMETGSSFADVRNFCGFGTIGLDGTDAPGGDNIWFRASSSTDTTWKLLITESTGGTTTTVDTGVPVTVSTRYDFWIGCQGDGCAYGYIGVAGSVMGGPYPVAIPSAFDQTASQNLFCQCENKTTTAKAIRWGKFYQNAE